MTVHGHRLLALREEPSSRLPADGSSASANHTQPGPDEHNVSVGFQAADDGGTGTNGPDQPPSRSHLCTLCKRSGPRDTFIHSHGTGLWYCSDFNGCDERRGAFNSTAA